MTDADLVAGFVFAQEAIKAFKPLQYAFLTNLVPFVLTQSCRPNQYGKRGFLAFTSATGARRGAPNCAISASGKFAIRGLSQTLAKEFKLDDIHVGSPETS